MSTDNGSNGVSPGERLEDSLARLEVCAANFEATADQRRVRNLLKVFAGQKLTRVGVRNLAMVEVLRQEEPA